VYGLETTTNGRLPLVGPVARGLYFSDGCPTDGVEVAGVTIA